MVAASLWRPLVITDAGERESAERELRDRRTRVSTGFAWAAVGMGNCLDCCDCDCDCCNCFLGDDFWVGGRRMGSDLQKIPKIIIEVNFLANSNI